MCAVGPVNGKIIQGSDYTTTPRIGLNMFIEMSKQHEFFVLSGGFGSKHL